MAEREDVDRLVELMEALARQTPEDLARESTQRSDAFAGTFARAKRRVSCPLSLNTEGGVQSWYAHAPCTVRRITSIETQHVNVKVNGQVVIRRLPVNVDIFEIRGMSLRLSKGDDIAIDPKVACVVWIEMLADPNVDAGDAGAEAAGADPVD